MDDVEFAFFVILLAVAGNETTRNAMTHGMNAFFENPDQWELFKRERPDTAADEIVRWATPVHCFQRTALADTELGGVTIREGQRVGLFYSSANYDEAVFDRPFEFNILRDPNPHLGFGGNGAHFCIGANLARMEIKLIFNEIADQIPNISKLSEPQRLRSGWLNGVKRARGLLPGLGSSIHGVRTHGWSGSAPASDDEAIARILDAASKAIDARGADFSIADVARTLGVTRQTVYRYFPSTDALLVAAAVHAASDFHDRLAAHLQGITDPVEAVAEAIATALEWLPKDKHLGLLIVPGRPNPHIESVTSDVALDFAHSMVRRFDVDWAGLGFTDADLDELAEHLLRIIQSFVIDPGRPPRQGDELRGYLRRWVGAAIRPSAAKATSAPRTPTSTPPLNLAHRDLAAIPLPRCRFR